MCDLISRFGHPPELQICVITTTTRTIIIIKEKKESRVYCCCSKSACRSSISPAGFLGEKGVVTVSLSISLLGMRYVRERERERERESASFVSHANCTTSLFQEYRKP
jgi:hypothetical protein